MPRVDPTTHQPISDAEDGPDQDRGGRLPSDPNLADASENGGTARPEGELGDSWAVAPGEKPSEGGED
jgi:hypothetical protein